MALIATTCWPPPGFRLSTALLIAVLELTNTITFAGENKFVDLSLIYVSSKDEHDVDRDVRT